MKKKICFVVTLLISLCIMPKVSAASMSLSTNKTTVTVGSTVTATVRVSSVAGRFSVSSSNGNVLSGGGSVFLDNNSQSYTFTAKKVGTATITAVASDASDYNEKPFSGSRSVTIKVVNKSSGSSNSSSTPRTSTPQKNTEPEKSNNNTLKELSIEGQKISPDFNKDKTDYTLTVENETEKIKINASAADSKAKVEGTGEKKVKEGENKFEVVVTAENGEKKTYKITVTVDTKPINVTIDGEEYTVVKKKEELPELKFEHEETTLNIDEQDVPAYRIDSLGYILVALKDKEGDIKLYKFDSFKGEDKPFEYTLFRQFKSPEELVVYLDFPKKLIPKNYKKYKEEINGEEVDVYKFTKGSRYSLFYGANIETGKKNIYRYDKKEKTFQVYEREEAESLEQKIEEMSYVLVSLVGVSALLLLIIVILLATRKKGKKKKVKQLEK